MKKMNEEQLPPQDLEYVADMLKAIAFFKDEIDPLSEQTLKDLDQCLRTAEAALRRTVAELKSSNAEHKPKN
jgi:hypothetical protein